MSDGIQRHCVSWLFPIPYAANRCWTETMNKQVQLHGYRYSVYNRIARLALHCKDVDYDICEVNPFDDTSKEYSKLQPFGRVPVLTHGSFSLYETSAITRYVDRSFDGVPLQPKDPSVMARVDQVISIIDSYAYWPMVRQVFAQRVFRPLEGESTDENEIIVGLDASKRVLMALDAIAVEGQVLSGHSVTLADCHLAPVIGYFVKAEEGQALLSQYPALNDWWEQVATMDMLKATDPLR